MTGAAFRRGAWIWALLAGSLLAACSYRGDIDNPLTLKATWLSYLNGDDIRAACVEGAPPRYRLIYNADYDEQLRSYELVGDGAGGAQLTARVLGPSGLVVNEVTFSDPLAFTRWTRSEARLDAGRLAEFDAALAASGAFAPAPQGLQLFSKETYWISNLCRDGVFHFNAWRFPSDRYAAITFDALLFALDETGIPVREPVAVPVGASAKANAPRRSDSDDSRGNYFNVKVGENGLTNRLAF
ncbi:MAG: hypothetical protein GEU89_15225 [Kiloniellaceae bacterium]|nr:hypothetical protein [Kiloniellaceae bacterium]